MRCLIIFGSPRKDGNTAALLEPFMDELNKLEADIYYHDVYDKNISGCRACLACQEDEEHICCIIKDDMLEILSEIPECDALVIASPIYAWSAPAPVKAVIDRLIYSSCKYYGNNPKGPALMEGKQLFLLTTCGYPKEKASDLYEEAMRRYCKHCGLIFGGIITERQRNLNDTFMDSEKEGRVRNFARIVAAKMYK